MGVYVCSSRHVRPVGDHALMSLERNGVETVASEMLLPPMLRRSRAELKSGRRWKPATLSMVYLVVNGSKTATERWLLGVYCSTQMRQSCSVC